MQEVHIYRIDASGHGFQKNRPISRYTRDTALRAVFGHPVMKLFHMWSACGRFSRVLVKSCASDTDKMFEIADSENYSHHPNNAII